MDSTTVKPPRTPRRWGTAVLLALPVLLATAACGFAELGLAGDEATPVREVHVTYSWTGWGSRGYVLNVVCADDACRATSTCKAGDPAVTVTNEPTTVPLPRVQALGVVLQGLTPVDEPTEVIEHTDDYPVFDIRLVTEDGESIEVGSTSNTQKNMPWNVRRDGQWFVNEGEQFPDAYAALLRDIGPTSCWG